MTLRRAGLWASLLAMACGARTPVVAENLDELPFPPLPSAETCNRLRDALGYPQAEVKGCRQMRTLPGVYLIALQAPDLYVQRAVITQGDDVWVHTGPAAAVRFFEDWDIAHRQPIDATELVWVLDGLKVTAGGFDTNTAGQDVAGVGKTGITYDPFRLTLIRPLPSGSMGGYAQPSYERVDLICDNGVWTWISYTTGPALGPERARWTLAR